MGAGEPHSERALLAWAAAAGIPVREAGLLREALTHDSAAPLGNERLELLGDAVLDLVVGEHLLQRFPTWDEGSITRARARVVCTASLAAAARALDLGARLCVGAGMRGQPLSDAVLAGAFEAIVGAVYREGGLEAARAFVLRALDGVLRRIEREGAGRSPKSALQLLCHRDLQLEPDYVLEQRSGPDHAPSFAVAVYVGGRRYGSGAGATKKEAEQRAAEATLRHLLGARFERLRRGELPPIGRGVQEAGTE